VLTKRQLVPDFLVELVFVALALQVMRVFYDRLVEDKDRLWFLEFLKLTVTVSGAFAYTVDDQWCLCIHSGAFPYIVDDQWCLCIHSG